MRNVTFEPFRWDDGKELSYIHDGRLLLHQGAKGENLPDAVLNSVLPLLNHRVRLTAKILQPSRSCREDVSQQVEAIFDLGSGAIKEVEDGAGYKALIFLDTARNVGNGTDPYVLSRFRDHDVEMSITDTGTILAPVITKMKEPKPEKAVVRTKEVKPEPEAITEPMDPQAEQKETPIA